jgi:hypothetical protein
VSHLPICWAGTLPLEPLYQAKKTKQNKTKKPVLLKGNKKLVLLLINLLKERKHDFLLKFLPEPG